MVPNAEFWAHYFREFHVRTIEGFGAGALENVAAAFSSIAEEADAAAEAEFDRLGCMPADDEIGMGDVAEWATEHGIEYYETMSGVRQGLLNLSAVGLHHLFEQQQLFFLRRELARADEGAFQPAEFERRLRGATRPRRCDGGTPAGAENRRFSDGSLPYTPMYPGAARLGVRDVWITLIAKDLRASRV